MTKDLLKILAIAAIIIITSYFSFWVNFHPAWALCLCLCIGVMLSAIFYQQQKFVKLSALTKGVDGILKHQNDLLSFQLEDLKIELQLEKSKKRVAELKREIPKAKTIKEITPSWENAKVVYIAGKVTDLPYAEVVEKFERAHQILALKGFEVINPIRLVHQDADWRQAMRICISYLPHADFIYLLPDYKESKGATLEAELAEQLGIDRIYIKEKYPLLGRSC